MAQADDQAREIAELWDRLSRLSQASLRINESLDFDTVLQGVLDSACSLTGARYGVITLLDESGQVQDFVTSGLTAEERRRFTDLPEGMMFFQYLSNIQEPLRLRDFHSHIRSLGLPEFQPPMAVSTPLPFLAAPIRHLGESVGAFYVGEKEVEFTTEDEETLVMFASQAALVIANARRHRDEQRARADMETLVNTTPVGVLVFDAKTGGVTSVNREARRIVSGLHMPGGSAEQLLDMLTFRRADGREISLEEFPLAQALSTGETVRAEEIVIKVPGGGSVTTLVNATPIRSEEAEAEVIRRVFRMYVREGMGARVIAKLLTAEGVPTPRAVGKWYDGTVTRILRHEAYRGTWWFGKRRHVATEHWTRRYDRPEDEWVGVPFPPVVDDEIWEQAQEAKKQRLTRSGRNTKLFYLLQHLVRCAECGYLMGCRANKRDTSRRKGKDYIYDLDTPRRYYNCYGMLNEGVKCREHSHIRAEPLEEVVWGEVKRLLENPGLIVASIEAMDCQADGGGLADETAKAERDLQKVQMEEDRAIRLFVSGKITEKQLDHQRKFITERLETLRKVLDDHRARESAQAEKRALAEHIVEWTRRPLSDRLDSLSDKGRREVLEILLDGGDHRPEQQSQPDPGHPD